MPNGLSVTHTSRKITVSAASKIVSAISFGVFWRCAPSTSEIMRSRKPSPGLTETRILISSDSTRVPPVTALRSPPLSRMTGADSPVMADSSTVAAPSITSPSAGIISPARTTTMSSLRNSVALISSMPFLPSRRVFGVHARFAQRLRLRLAAAFGHRLGEIGEQHGEPQPQRDLRDEAAIRRGGENVHRSSPPRRPS